MKTYTFRVIVEEDPYGDGKMAYHIHCPDLEEYGASTWGYTEKEALKNIREVVEMIIEELIEEEKPIPEVQIFTEPMVTIAI